MSPFSFFGGNKAPSVLVSVPDTDAIWFESTDVEATWDARDGHRFLRVFATQRNKRNALKSFLTLSMRFADGAAVDGRMQHNGSMSVFDGPVRAAADALTFEDDLLHATLESKAYLQDAEGEDPTVLALELRNIRPETDRRFVDNLEKIVRATPDKFPDILHWFDLSAEQRKHRRPW